MPLLEVFYNLTSGPSGKNVSLTSPIGTWPSSFGIFVIYISMENSEKGKTMVYSKLLNYYSI